MPDAPEDARRFFELFEREMKAAKEFYDRRDAEMLRRILREPSRDKSEQLKVWRNRSYNVTPRERRHAAKLKHWYGLSVCQFDELLDRQGQRCALCGEPFDNTPSGSAAIDHCHVTGIIRGVVHQRCNRGLGHFEDNPVRLEQAALYLRTANTGLNANTGKWRASLKRQKLRRARRKEINLTKRT